MLKNFFLKTKSLLDTKGRFEYYTAIFALIGGTISAISTYIYVSDSSNILGPDPRFVSALVLADLLFFLLLTIIVAKNIHRFFSRVKKIKASKLRSRMVISFSLIAAVPTIIVSIFSVIFFNYGLESWFNQRVSTALDESSKIAHLYLEEHQKLIKYDALNLAIGIDRNITILLTNPMILEEYLSSQAEEKKLTEVALYRAHPFRIIAKSKFSILSTYKLQNEEILSKSKDNVVIIQDNDKITAVIRLENAPGSYLWISKPIDREVFGHWIKTRDAHAEYQKLREQSSQLQAQFASIFFIVSLLIILIAITIGLIISTKIARSLAKLLSATERIAHGDFSIKLPEGDINDEIALLSSSFNIMAKRLDDNREELITANRLIDERRHFSETVLFGVSAGIIVVDVNRNITMINPSAKSLLRFDGEMAGQSINIILPEIKEILEDAIATQKNVIQKELQIKRKGRQSIFVMNILTESFDKKTSSYIITFDDITPLVLAQRSAAWSDVARKIAHEIKNPLTPITLAAERLNKKYYDKIEDKESFSKYIDIVKRHVDDIRRMVEEFVNFARMPSANLTSNNICEIIQNAIFSRESLGHKVQYHFDYSDREIMVKCDAGQISQAFLNLFKNAEEAILEAKDNGNINIDCSRLNSNMLEIVIKDDGPGFKDEIFDKLASNYVTTKQFGTGLGLAIVKKILDDHNATIEFANHEENGAIIKIQMHIVS